MQPDVRGGGLGAAVGELGRAGEEAGALMLLLQAKATREERWLRERYPEYRDYEQRMKRFVPWVW